MDEETRVRCVDPFYSTKEQGKGTGLGLGIVQHIVTDHGGALEIESDTREGHHGPDPAAGCRRFPVI